MFLKEKWSLAKANWQRSWRRWRFQKCAIHQLSLKNAKSLWLLTLSQTAFYNWILTSGVACDIFVFWAINVCGIPVDFKQLWAFWLFMTYLGFSFSFLISFLFPTLVHSSVCAVCNSLCLCTFGCHFDLRDPAGLHRPTRKRKHALRKKRREERPALFPQAAKR